jgi:hypothetical protein
MRGTDAPESIREPIRLLPTPAEPNPAAGPRLAVAPSSGASHRRPNAPARTVHGSRPVRTFRVAQEADGS